MFYISLLAQIKGTESESQSPPHQQKNVTVTQQNHKIQNQPPTSQHMQQSMPPGGPRMSPHQMPQQNYAPMHNYQPPPHGAHGPYTPPYGSPQQVRMPLFPFNYTFLISTIYQLCDSHYIIQWIQWCNRHHIMERIWWTCNNSSNNNQAHNILINRWVNKRAKAAANYYF